MKAKLIIMAIFFGVLIVGALILYVKSKFSAKKAIATVDEKVNEKTQEVVSKVSAVETQVASQEKVVQQVEAKVDTAKESIATVVAETKTEQEKLAENAGFQKS